MRYSYCMKETFRIGFCLLLLGTLFRTPLLAQRPDLQNPIGSTRQDTVQSGILPLDTIVPMTYVLIGDPAHPYAVSDTFQWEDNRHYPMPGYMAHLGNYGSAARSLAPESDAPLGFSTGWLQYEPYFLHEESFRYYNQDVPVSNIKYSQAGQEDTYLTLDFGRSFAKGLSLSVAYRRINQVGEFAHQRQKDTGFGVGVWHHAPSGRYDAFYNYLNNAVVAEENGGISQPELIGQTNVPDESVPVYIYNGITTHKHRIFLTRQILHLLPDSTGLGIDLWMKGSFATGIYKYVDEQASSAAAYYSDDFLTDDRGIRQYTYLRENNWSFGIALPWRSAHSTLNVSLRYRGINLQQEPTQRNINELYFDASAGFHWLEPLELKGDLSLGLGQADGVISFKAGADLDLSKMGHLLGYWSLLTRKPYLVESSLYVSQLPVYQFDYRNPLVNEIGVTWDLRRQQLQASARWLLFDNYIYFDSSAFPRQIEGSFSIKRLSLTKVFHIKSIGLKGSAFWQPDARPELAIPTWWFTAGCFGQIEIFEKKVTIIPGVDVNYNDALTGITYFPVNGSYHLTDGPVIPEAFRVDVGLGLQIKFLKAFVRFEDFVGLFKDRVLYQADFYPHYRGYFRLGLEASFFN